VGEDKEEARRRFSASMAAWKALHERAQQDAD
jgi:hypothetical protein